MQALLEHLINASSNDEGLSPHPGNRARWSDASMNQLYTVLLVHLFYHLHTYIIISTAITLSPHHLTPRQLSKWSLIHLWAYCEHFSTSATNILAGILGRKIDHK